MGLCVIVKKYLNDKYNNFKQIEWVERGGGFKFSRPMNFVNKYGIEFVDID